MKSNVITELLSVASRLLNVLAGGTADMTLSARAGRDNLWIRPLLDQLFMKIAGERDHCAASWSLHLIAARQALRTSRVGEREQEEQK